ncbi:MAG: hypothetical protein WBM59_01530, partial [Sedimenticolaceae bacterium]
MFENHRVLLKAALISALYFALSLGAIADYDRANTIRLATTTSTENSGLLNELLPRFKEATGY